MVGNSRSQHCSKPLTHSLADHAQHVALNGKFGVPRSSARAAGVSNGSVCGGKRGIRRSDRTRIRLGPWSSSVPRMDVLLANHQAKPVLASTTSGPRCHCARTSQADPVAAAEVWFVFPVDLVFPIDQSGLQTAISVRRPHLSLPLCPADIGLEQEAQMQLARRQMILGTTIAALSTSAKPARSKPVEGRTVVPGGKVIWRGFGDGPKTP